MTDVNHLLPIGGMGDTDGGKTSAAQAPKYLRRGTNKPDSFAPRTCSLGKLAAVELGVKATCREQFIVRAALDNLAIAHY